MATQTKTAILNDIVDAFGAKDLDRLRTLVDDHVVYQETGTGRRVEGIDAYLDVLGGWLTGFPDVTGKVTSGLEDANQAAVEVIWAGTHTGPLALPDGELPATDKGFEVAAVLWCTFRGDKVAEIRNHLDVMTLAQQLGLQS